MAHQSPSFLIQSVRKRDGRVVPFDKNRISSAVLRAMQASGEGDVRRNPFLVADRVVRRLRERYPRGGVPSIEAIQDIVEESLILLDFPKTAKGYILYRNQRAQVREKTKEIPKHVRDLAEKSKQYFKNDLAEFIYYRTYSRWIEKEGRRETWIETVDRYVNFMRENIGDQLSEHEYRAIRDAIVQQEVMPSMRLLWSAGKAARKTNAAAYNCSYIAPKKLEDFAEIMYLLMCGTGVGFSVEAQTVQQLPIVKRQIGEKLATHMVGDSKEGWADALTLGLRTWYEGKDITFDYSRLRSAGARLSTMGGRSSGPEPLRALLDFSRSRILARQGRRLSNLDIHDIICKTGEVVVMGGVRRSALISLSDLDDKEMRHAKTGQFYLTEPQRSMANNSAVYNEKPSAAHFMQEWLALALSGTGERGIFNRGSLEHQLPERRWGVFNKHSGTSGTNPCGEIVLRSKQFCNLSEVVARPDDTEETLLRKTYVATILGTYQSSLTNFSYISKEWKKNCEEERLLGVSITGQWDSSAVRNPETLRKMKQVAIRTNEKFAERFGINPSTCITCVKPSGTVSQLVDASSGMHTRHAPYYIRRVRIAASDPLFHMLKDQKFPYHPEVGQHETSATTFVLEFPVQAPAASHTNLHAIDQLKHWETVKRNFTEHNPSVTVSVAHDEWIETANWLYKRWNILGGLSFLPKSEHAYQLAPYEAISKEKYHDLCEKMPKIDFAQIVAYEKEDNTTGAKELACVAGTCEIDIDADEGRIMPEKITSVENENDNT